MKMIADVTHEQLKNAIELIGLSGEWKYCGDYKQYRIHNGGLINWWEPGRSVTVQGSPNTAMKLQEVLGTAADRKAVSFALKPAEGMTPHLSRSILTRTKPEFELQPVEIMVDKKGIYGLGTVADYTCCDNCGVAGIQWRKGGSIILRPDRIDELEDVDELVASRSNSVLQPIPIHGPFARVREGRFRELVHSRIRERKGLTGHPLHQPERFDGDLKIWHGTHQASTKIINRLVRQVIEQAADPTAIKMARRFGLSSREPIYRRASRSHRFLQLLEVFPLLGFEIGVPLRSEDGGSVSPEWRQRAREAANLVEKGAKLKVVAQCMGTPMALRKIMPGVAHLVGPEVRSQHPDLVRFLPQTTKYMRLWLKAIRLVRQRKVPEMLEWTAKNAMGLGAKRYHALEQAIINVSDWVRASRNNERHIDRKFSPDMSLNTVRRLSDEWHKAVEVSGGPQYTLPAPWIPQARIGAYDIIPLTVSEQVREEGRKMHHCVGSYLDRVTDGECYIYSIRRDGERIATMEVMREAGVIGLGQICGPCNRPVPVEVRRVATRFIGGVR
jgi:hypothetical protein